MDREKYLEIEHEHDVELRGHIETLSACAEVAQYLGDGKSTEFLTKIVTKLRRDRDWLLTPAQTQYVFNLQRRFAPKIPQLPELRRKYEEQQEAARASLLEKDRAERAEARSEEDFLLDLARDSKTEGWKATFDDIEWWFDYEAPPYKATIRKYQTDYSISVERDGKSVYTRKYTETPQGRGDAYRREEAAIIDKAKRMALGAIEKDRRSQAPQAPAEPSPKDRIEQIERLAAAARAAKHPFFTGLTDSVLAQLRRGRPPTARQEQFLAQGLKQFRIASTYDYDRRR
jgi:hypothetical protein